MGRSHYSASRWVLECSRLLLSNKCKARGERDSRPDSHIIVAQDDPIIPFASFRDPGILGNPFISLIATRYGGHCGFVSRYAGDERFWAESRIVDFCEQQLQMACDSPMKMQEAVRWCSRRQSATSIDRTVGAC